MHRHTHTCGCTCRTRMHTCTRGQEPACSRPSLLELGPRFRAPPQGSPAARRSWPLTCPFVGAPQGPTSLPHAPSPGHSSGRPSTCPPGVRRGESAPGPHCSPRPGARAPLRSSSGSLLSGHAGPGCGLGLCSCRPRPLASCPMVDVLLCVLAPGPPLPDVSRVCVTSSPAQRHAGPRGGTFAFLTPRMLPPRPHGHSEALREAHPREEPQAPPRTPGLWFRSPVGAEPAPGPTVRPTCEGLGAGDGPSSCRPRLMVQESEGLSNAVLGKTQPGPRQLRGSANTAALALAQSRHRRLRAVTRAALPSARPGPVGDRSDEEGEGPPAGGGRRESCPPWDQRGHEADDRKAIYNSARRVSN